MGKKQLIALADAIKRINLRVDTEPSYGGLADDSIDTVRLIIYQELNTFCKSQSERFNEQVWGNYILGLCGPSGGKKK